MADMIITVVPQDPNVVGMPEDLLISTRQEDLKIVVPVDDMVIIPKVADMTIAVAPTDPLVAVTDIGPPGPQGLPGTGAATVVIADAFQPLGGQRIVKPVPGGYVDYASSDNVADADAILGVTQGAANANEEITVQTGGVMEEPSWSFIVGQPVYCGLNGVPTQTPPTSGFLCRIGKAIEPTKLYINVEEAIILA